MTEARTFKHFGEFELIGPVRLPLQIESDRAEVFTSWFYGFANAGYNALTIGDVATGHVLVRIQSKCTWGIEYGSLYCDCKWQLDESRRRIADEGAGVIIYCHDHGGKGVGTRLHNLVYAEGQARGHELVVDAYLGLGLREDYRDYRDVAQILGHLGVQSIRLLTNSPSRLEALQCLGIDLHHCSLEAPPNIYLREEYEAKKKKLGHLLTGDVLS